MIDNYVAPRAGCYVSRMGTESLYAAVAKERARVKAAVAKQARDEKAMCVKMFAGSKA